MRSGTTRFDFGLAAALALGFTSGCASTYVPRPSPRIALVMDGGSYAYLRNGRKYEGGLFGGDLVEVVRGDPKAEEYARAYKIGQTTGLGLTVLGAAGALVGLGVLGADTSQHSAGQPPPPAGLIVIGSGLVVELIGALIAANTAPHLFDAVNAYNDSVDSDGAAPPPAPAPAPAPR